MSTVLLMQRYLPTVLKSNTLWGGEGPWFNSLDSIAAGLLSAFKMLILSVNF